MVVRSDSPVDMPPCGKDGFLLDTKRWRPEIATAMADHDGITLSASHWEIIEFVRGYYAQYHVVPIMRILARAIANQLGADKGKSRYLYSLFPEGPVRQASRYGGLPKPPSCI